MAHTFTSLRHAIEKLLEAEYFLLGANEAGRLEFQFNLNAFLAACRSVTFVLQKSMATVPGFAPWYQEQVRAMRQDKEMSFFLELRNISQHEGPVSYVAGATLTSPERSSYRFAGNRESVPDALTGVDVISACADHLVKLSTLLKEFSGSFPFSYCPSVAVSAEGMSALGYCLDDIGQALGLPQGYLEAGSEIPVTEKLRLLTGEFEPADTAAVERIASRNFLRSGRTVEIPDSAEDRLLDSIAHTIEQGDQRGITPRLAFITAIMRRIDDSIGD